MRPRVLLLSGTSEGPLIAKALIDAGLEVAATVTRSAAVEDLFGSPLDRLTVEVRGFDAESLSDYLRRGTHVVLDATHPFAVRITKTARAVCETLGTPYVRYERPDWIPKAGTVFADGFAEAANVAPSLGSRIMLTIGAKQLKHFAHLHDRLALFARILPAAESLAQANAAGFSSDRVFCMRPPFSREFNRAFFAEYRAEVLVTKASGAAGGVIEKVEAALDLGMTVLMIRRPEDDPTDRVSTIAEAVAACREAVAGFRRPGLS